LDPERPLTTRYHSIMRTAFLLIAFTACSTDTFTGPDGSTGSDGGSSDDRNGGDAAPCTSNFCGSQSHTTCDDFDEAIPPKWANDITATGATIDPTQSTATSCPNAMQVVFPVVATAIGEPHAYAVAQLGTSAHDVTLAFDALIPQFPSSSTGNVDGFVIFGLRETVDGSWSVRLERSPDQHWFVRLHQGTGTSQNLGGSNVDDILLGAWNHMSLTVHYAADNTGTASFTYQNDKAPVTVQLANVQTMGTAAGEYLTFAAGAAALSATSKPYTFLYDSIAIDAN
jgi:hypothetical protein